jgi:1-acyl-sn-glycerol-3-phosphate acyltransferase
MKRGTRMLYRIAQIFFRIYFFIYHRASIRGLGELRIFFESRGKRPVVLAANHESYLDPPAIGMVFPYPLRFVAWDGLFGVPVLRTLIRALGAVPVSQENKNSAAGVIRDVIGFIRGGYSVLIFPEGKRTPDGSLQPLEGGAALIASMTGSAIVPIWVDTFEAYPVFRVFPRPRHVAVTFGCPILPEELPEMSEKDRRKTLLAMLERALIEMRDAPRGIC